MKEPEQNKGYWGKYLSRLFTFLVIFVVIWFLGMFVAKGFEIITLNFQTSLSLAQVFFVAAFAVSFAGLVERWIYDSKKKDCLVVAKIDNKTIQEIHEIWEYVNRRRGKYQK